MVKPVDLFAKRFHDWLEESLSITIKIAASLGEKNFVTLATLVKERTAVSVRYFTGVNVKNVDVIITEVLI